MKYGKVVELRHAHENYVGLLLKGKKIDGKGKHYRKATEQELCEASRKVWDCQTAIAVGTCFNLEAIV